MRLITVVLASIGRGFLGLASTTGQLALFTGPAVSRCFVPPLFGRVVLRQMIEIGYYSLPVVGLTALFTGMVLALQSYTGFARFNAEGAIANVVVLSMTRELGPVLAGLMVAGRVGAAMAGRTRHDAVTEQIDALSTLSTNPFKYLIAPRLTAGVLVMPPLVLIDDVIGVLGGWIIAVYKLGFSSGVYLQNTVSFIQFNDVFSGPGQSRRVRLPDHLDGLLPGLPLARRRPRRRPGNHLRGGQRLDPDPGLRLRADRAVLRQMSDQPKIRLRDVRKSFGGKRVLQGIDLDVPAGQSLVVIGGSGSGKSVTIKCILGLLRADAGRIEVDGDDVTHVRGTAREAMLRKFGMLFQGSALFDSLPVWQNVAFGLIQGRGMKRDQGTRDRDPEAGGRRARPGRRRAVAGRAVRRHAEAGRAGARDRGPTRRSSSSTSRPPAWTRSWPT